MARIVFFALALALSALSALAQGSRVAHGLIVQLRPAPIEANSRELPSALHAQREVLAQEQMAAVSQGARISAPFTHRQISGEHRLMRFAHALKGQELEDTMRRLRLHPDVLSVEPNVRLRLLKAPNDPSFAQQWHFGSSASAQFASALNMTRTWAVTTGTSVTVAVIDTGVRFGHPDLARRLLPGYDFIEDVENGNDGDGRDADASDPGDWVTYQELTNPEFSGCDAADSSWHGTFIAGQIAAATDNGLGVAGMNWNARILPVRVSGKCGALLSDLMDGMRWAAGLAVDKVPNNPNPAKVLNISFGGSESCLQTRSLQRVIDEVTSAGALVVVAAGNGDPGGGDDMQLKRPADCDGVLAVGAVQANGLKTHYSYVGSNMALMAPGGDGRASDASTLLLSTSNAGPQGPGLDSYDRKAGTSFAAPLAAGAAALMLAVNPALSPSDLAERLMSSAKPHVRLAGIPNCSFFNTGVCTCTTLDCGAGMLDPAAAVQAALAPTADIAAVQTPTAGSTVQLNGAASSAVGTATIASYQWQQRSGSTLAISNPYASVTQVVLPAAQGNFVFRLTVTDNLGRTGFADLDFTSVASGSSNNVGGTGVSSNGNPSNNAGGNTGSSTASADSGGGADDPVWLALLAFALISIALTHWHRYRRQQSSRNRLN